LPRSLSTANHGRLRRTATPRTERKATRQGVKNEEAKVDHSPVVSVHAVTPKAALAHRNLKAAAKRSRRPVSSTSPCVTITRSKSHRRMERLIRAVTRPALARPPVERGAAPAPLHPPSPPARGPTHT